MGFFDIISIFLMIVYFTPDFYRVLLLRKSGLLEDLKIFRTKPRLQVPQKLLFTSGFCRRENCCFYSSSEKVIVTLPEPSMDLSEAEVTFLILPRRVKVQVLTP